jgi:signal peptidase
MAEELVQNTKKKSKGSIVKKVLRIVGDVLFGIFLVFMLFISITNIRAKTSNNIPNIFGQGYLNVLSDSMEGENDDSFKIGDLLFVKLVNQDEAKKLQVGQIITYKSTKYQNNDGDFYTISHRIIEVNEIDGYTYYTTKGDNPLSKFAEDGGKEVVRDQQVLAVYQGKWAGAGSAFAWFGTGTGFFIIVVVPCILFLIFTIISFVKTYIEYKNGKKEVALAGGPDSMQNKIRLRKEALEELVADGTISQEQADAKLNEYIDSVMNIDSSNVVANEISNQEVQEASIQETPVEETKEVANEVTKEVVKEEVAEVTPANEEKEEVSVEPTKAPSKKPSKTVSTKRKQTKDASVKGSKTQAAKKTASSKKTTKKETK